MFPKLEGLTFRSITFFPSLVFHLFLFMLKLRVLDGAQELVLDVTREAFLLGFSLFFTFVISSFSLRHGSPTQRASTTERQRQRQRQRERERERWKGLFETQLCMYI